MAEDEEFSIRQSHIKSDSYPPPRQLQSGCSELMKQTFVERKDSFIGILKIVER